MLNVIINGKCVQCEMDACAEQLIQELVALNTSVIDSIVDESDLKEGERALLSKLDMADIVNTFVKGYLIGNIEQELTDKVPMTLNEIISKWMSIMQEHTLSNTEMTVFQREVKQAGFTVEQVIDGMMFIISNKEVR